MNKRIEGLIREQARDMKARRLRTTCVGKILEEAKGRDALPLLGEIILKAEGENVSAKPFRDLLIKTLIKRGISRVFVGSVFRLTESAVRKIEGKGV
jgi:hypothetical protein